MNKTIKQYQGCIGCGACVGICPQFFQFNNETFKAELIDGQTQPAVSVGSRPNQEFTALQIETTQLDDSTADLLTGSCCANVIAVENN